MVKEQVYPVIDGADVTVGTITRVRRGYTWSCGEHAGTVALNHGARGEDGMDVAARRIAIAAGSAVAVNGGDGNYTVRDADGEYAGHIVGCPAWGGWSAHTTRGALSVYGVPSVGQAIAVVVAGDDEPWRDVPVLDVWVAGVHHGQVTVDPYGAGHGRWMSRSLTFGAFEDLVHPDRAAAVACVVRVTPGEVTTTPGTVRILGRQITWVA